MVRILLKPTNVTLGWHAVGLALAAAAPRRPSGRLLALIAAWHVLGLAGNLYYRSQFRSV